MPARISSAELTDVLRRPKFRRWVSTQAASDFITGLEDAPA